jgi:2'-5' RNA ligase
VRSSPPRISEIAYQPFIDDPEHIRLLEGQRFVVLRPGRAVREAHRDVQRLLRQQFPAFPLSYPARAHVTLAGFESGTPLDALQKLVESWARAVSAFRIAADRVTFFPPPFQIAIVQVSKTPELFAALSALRQRADEKRLAVSTAVPARDWIFHMSVAYCSGLTPPIWNELAQFVQTLEVDPVHCFVDEAEVVAFDDGREYSGGVYALGGDLAAVR